MLCCCGKTRLQHACKSYVSAKIHNLLVREPASLFQWLHWNSSQNDLVLQNTARGTIPTEAQHMTQTFEQDAEEEVSNTNSWLKQCLESEVVSGSLAGRNRVGFTYCQSFCAALSGSSAQSDQPLSSWLQIHFGFCLQSSPPSHWCSRYSLVGRFAGAPLKWQKM